MALQVFTFLLWLHIYGKSRKVRGGPRIPCVLQGVARVASLYRRDQS